ncbi:MULTISPECIES: hypothetical protein [Paenibacillus]|uniref:Uncharacterized protein n=1 Tax=Paenibacillus pabuli TaxID=1472 RepID=A0A855XYD2_9BACL|nr:MULTISPECIES: hypothetical protein [Paenibacillus]PWW40924.1 hypothetical protein DET56_105197 [Paenibacillus pabuli]PXW12048.1 hypothetical protein DEU73_101920 [Paenibacillus taichungensis]RAI97237.1 hypothetical protein DET54_105200 [Paenibacillus pabuli]
MGKLYKTILSLVLSFSFLVSVQPNSAEAASNSLQTESVKMLLTTIDIPVAEDQELVRYEEANSVKVEVIDKSTGEVTEVYSESLEANLQAKALGLASSNILSTSKTRTDGPVQTQLLVKMVVSGSGSFAQINSIASQTMSIINSNGFTLEDKDVVAIPVNNTFPTYKIEASGSGVLTYSSTNGTSAGISFDILEAASFNMSGSSSSTWYARKPISMNLTYSVQ